MYDPVIGVLYFTCWHKDRAKGRIMVQITGVAKLQIEQIEQGDVRYGQFNHCAY